MRSFNWTFLAALLASRRVLVLLVACVPAAHADDVRDRLQLFDDGKHHLLAYAADPDPEKAIWYYGDTAALTILATQKKQAKQPGVTWSFEDPRYQSKPVELNLADATLTLACGKRKTTFHPITAKLAAKAELKPISRREPIYLARDDDAIYYYVDRARSRDDGVKLELRLYVGKRGALKPLALKDIAEDSAGVLLVSAQGKFRYDRGADTYQWIGPDKQPRTLTPVWTDRELIFNELGVYAGQRLGTPCDDL